MDADAVQKKGMSVADVTAMIAAWSANQQAWRDALVAAGKFEWFLFYGGQQTAPGQNQTCGQCTCQKYLEVNCGAGSPSQNGTLFYGFSRTTHHTPWPLPTPDQDIAMFLLSRGPCKLSVDRPALPFPGPQIQPRNPTPNNRPTDAIMGYGWAGCYSLPTHPFTRPARLDQDFGTPLNFCSETSPGSQVWTRNYTKLNLAVDCSSFTATYDVL